MATKKMAALLYALAITTLVCAVPTKARAISPSDQDLVMNSFDNEFYVVTPDGCGYFKVDTSGRMPDKTHFWQTAEEIEVVEDAYERSHEPVYKGMIGQLVMGLDHLADGQEPNPSDWCSWNIYNDDIMWGCIALVRAYRDTGDYAYVEHAAQQFDEAWNRPYGWDSAHGGFFWRSDPGTPGLPSKNSCVNCPACIAASLLAQCYRGSNDFLQRAVEIYGWEIDNLFDTHTGAVYDSVPTDDQGNPIWSRLNKGTLTYNQGTLIGASMALREALQKVHTHTVVAGDEAGYLKNASLAASYTRDSYTARAGHGGILPDESGDGDTRGMKGIFMRWCGMWARETRNGSYMRWLQENADTAWNNRDAHGLTWSQWWHVDPNSFKEAWGCSGAVAACQDVAPN